MLCFNSVVIQKALCVFIHGWIYSLSSAFQSSLLSSDEFTYINSHSQYQDVSNIITALKCLVMGDTVTRYKAVDLLFTFISTFVSQ